jgi:antitoxin component YwqK of YwqJK toxin-antitoxin module
MASYSKGILNGSYKRFDSQTVLLENGTFSNGQIIGDYITYHSNSNRKSVVTFAQGQEIGHEKRFDSNDRLFSEGSIKRNLNSNSPKQFKAIGKWFYFTYKSNGKVKRKTVKIK